MCLGLAFKEPHSLDPFFSPIKGSIVSFVKLHCRSIGVLDLIDKIP